MAQKLNRRQLLQGTAAVGAGVAIRRPPGSPSLRRGQDHGRRRGRLSLREILCRARRRVHQGDRRRRSRSISIPHDNIRQQFAQDAIAGAGGFDVYIADQVWLPEFAEKGFIVDLTDALSAHDKCGFRRPRARYGVV